MRRKLLLNVLAATFVAMLLGVAAFERSDRASAQTTTPDDKKMPEVIMLGKEAKLGQVTFNHVKHNGGAYNIDKSSPITCVACHHVARPQSEIAKLAAA